MTVPFSPGSARHGSTDIIANSMNEGLPTPVHYLGCDDNALTFYMLDFRIEHRKEQTAAFHTLFDDQLPRLRQTYMRQSSDRRVPPLSALWLVYCTGLVFAAPLNRPLTNVRQVTKFESCDISDST